VTLRALVDALKFRGAQPDAFINLTPQEWQRVVAMADRAQLTFPLGEIFGDILPDEVRSYIEVAALHNGERNRRFQAAYKEIAERLSASGIEHTVLKGFSHCPQFCPDVARRLQVDIDLWVPRRDIQRAGEIAKSLGYQPLEGMENYPVDHLPTMLRHTGWQFRGDTYDPDIPPRLEIHFQLWDPTTERFEPDRLDAFWDRRVTESVDGLAYPSLAPQDRLAYACLHLLRHLLRGKVRPYHAYEIAWFLHQSADDSGFWELWESLHATTLKTPQAIVFAIVREWFACDLAPQAQQAVEQLNPGVRDWIKAHAFAPILPAHKSELWLHVMLVAGFRNRASIFLRRMLPMKVPRPTVGIETPPAQRSAKMRLHMRWTQVRSTIARAWHHARAFPPTLMEGIGWWSRSQEITNEFWQFLLAACLFEAGLFVFVLLYNLFLLGAGFGERSIGLFASAMTTGTLAGLLPAGMLLRRVSPNRVLAGCFLTISLVSAIRVSTTQEVVLTAAAFFAGAVLSVWAVSIPPTVAQLAGPRGRPRAFSLFAGSGIALGVIAGPLGGSLPKWLTPLGAAQPIRTALFIACGFIALAAWPASRLRLQRAPVTKAAHAGNPFLVRFLIAVTLGSLATGLFNPFFNVYFAKYLNFTPERIGWVFSASQFLQVLAILLSPLLFRKVGMTAGIALTQALAGTGLFFLAAGSASIAVPAYAAYMMFQYMNEPGLFTMLTDRVAPQNLSGASARYFFFTHAANALAAAAGGEAYARFGYPATLVVVGLGVLAGAALFWTLLANTRQMSS